MNKQQGISLVSLLVGLLVSMIVLVGMLMIFRNTIQAVVPASEDARSDGERVSGLLAAHIMLQDAGFGTNGNPTDHLLVLPNATLSGSSSATLTSGGAGGAVVWRKSVGATHTCEGLFAGAAGGLSRLSSDGCGSIGIDLGSITWFATPLIEPSRHPDGAVDAITFAQTIGVCRPFGIGTGITGNITVTISVKTPITNVTGHEVKSSTCLTNFPPSP